MVFTSFVQLSDQQMWQQVETVVLTYMREWVTPQSTYFAR